MKDYTYSHTDTPLCGSLIKSLTTLLLLLLMRTFALRAARDISLIKINQALPRARSKVTAFFFVQAQFFNFREIARDSSGVRAPNRAPGLLIRK